LNSAKLNNASNEFDHRVRRANQKIGVTHTIVAKV